MFGYIILKKKDLEQKIDKAFNNGITIATQQYDHAQREKQYAEMFGTSRSFYLRQIEAILMSKEKE